MIDLDALEAKAKGATPGLWETDYRQRYVFAATGVNVCEIRGYGELVHMVPECEAVEQMRSNGIYIAAANPATILELIAELRQTRELCGEHNQYIAELERTIKMYDNFVKSLAESLCIKHEEGWMPELDLIRAQMQLLKEIACSRKA